MKVILTTFLTAVSLLLAPALAIAEGDSIDQVYPVISAEDVKVYRQWSASNGRLVNGFQGQTPERVQMVIHAMEDFLKIRIQSHPDFNNYHWKILLYHTTEANAFAYLTMPEEGEEHDWLNKNPGKMWPIRKALKITDNKPIAFIGITTAMLDKLKKKGHLGFILGHEAKHIYDRHGVVSAGIGNHAKSWLDTQGKEVVADLGSLEFMLGHDRLEDALELLDMFNREATPKSEIGQHLRQAVESSAQVHHHPSVRQSLVQARAAYLNKHDRRAVQTPSLDIPRLWKSVAAKPLESPLLAERLMQRYVGAIEGIRALPGKVPFEKYYYQFIWKDSRSTVEELRDHPFIISKFLDLVVSSGLSNHQKAMALAGFLVQQMEFTGWQTYFSELPQGELLRWKRLLSGLSVKQDDLSLFDGNQDRLNRRVTLLELFNRGVFATKLGDDLTRSHRGWHQVIHNKLLPTLLNELLPTGKRPNFNGIDGILSKSNFELISRRSIDMDHQGNVHRALVTKIVERLESTRFEDLLIRDESRFKATPAELFEDFVVWLKVFERIYDRDNQQSLKIAGLDQTVDRLWNAYRNDIKSKLVGKMREIVSSADTAEYSQTLDKVGVGLAIMQKLDTNLFEDREIRTLLVQLVNKMINGSSESALSVVRFSIWNDIEEASIHRLVLKILSDSSLPAESRFYAVYGLTWGSGQTLNEIATKDPKVRAYLRLVLQKMGADRPGVIEQLLTGQEWNKQFKRLPPSGKLDHGDVSGMFPFQDYQLTLIQTIMSSGLISKLSDPTAEFLIKEIRWGIETFSRTGIDYMNSEYRSPTKGIEILIDWILSKVPSSTSQRDFLEWFLKLEDILKLAGKNFIFSSSQKATAGTAIVNGLKLFPHDQLLRALKSPSVRLALTEDQYAEKVLDYMNVVAPVEKGKAIMQAAFVQLEGELKLNDLNLEIKNKVQNKLSERHQVQPLEINTIFPADNRNETDKFGNKHALVRGLSLVVSFLENRSPLEQMHVVDFLMGRVTNPPKVVGLIQSELVKKHIKVNVESYLSMARSRLASATLMERTLAVNNLLAGQNSFLNTATGPSFVLNYLSATLPPDQSKIVKDFGSAVIKAEGRNASLFVSYVLAQKDKTEGNGQLAIELLIKGILDFYGVPGWKLAQYLGFSGEFKKFESALASYQDSAFPPEHMEILIYLRDHYAQGFDFTKVKILKILGTGSVNIAIEYLDLIDYKIKVINVPRENIKTQTQNDFKRFGKFLDELLVLPGAEKYRFLAGLLGTIEKSVNLEFDRASVLQRQKDAVEIYNGKSKGWKVRTVNTFGLVDDIILMEKAYGLGATKVVKTDKPLYKSAMEAVYEFEFNHLRGNLDKAGHGVVNIANPDLHDGQVFIEEKTNTVTVIDFGQAVPIDSKQRALGVDVLAFIGGIISAESYQQKLSMHRSLLGVSQTLTLASLQEIKVKADPMDRFVHLIALHSQAGIELPLATVHWIFGVNRLRVLGRKIGLSPDITIGTIAYGKIVNDAVKNIWQKIKPSGTRNNMFKNSCASFY